MGQSAAPAVKQRIRLKGKRRLKEGRIRDQAKGFDSYSMLRCRRVERKTHKQCWKLRDDVIWVYQWVWDFLTMELAHLYLSAEHTYFGHHGQPPGDAPMIEVERVRCVAGKGLEGDRFFDWKPDYKGQVTFFEQESLEWLEKALGVSGKSPSVFRRNIITRGLKLNGWIGKEFEIQGVRFLGTEEAKPCYWMDTAFAEGAEKALRGRGGLRAKVLNDGWLTRGAIEP